MVLATPFGMIDITIKDIRESELKLVNDFSSKEEVAVILHKSILRTLAMVDVVSQSGENSDKLKLLVDTMVQNIPSDQQDSYNVMF